jgi:hypothetical protein
MIVAISNLILGIVLCFMNRSSATDFLNSLTLNGVDAASKETAAVAIFHSLYAIGFLSLIFVIVHMCIYNKRRSFIDHISDTVVIKLIDISSNDSNPSANTKPSRKRRNYGLPGEIMTSAEKEIDSL